MGLKMQKRKIKDFNSFNLKIKPCKFNKSLINLILVFNLAIGIWLLNQDLSQKLKMEISILVNGFKEQMLGKVKANFSKISPDVFMKDGLKIISLHE